MKNRFFYLVLLFLITAAYATPELKAADVTVGATTWYTKWDVPESFPFPLDPTFLYGPVMSVKFSDDFSFTFVFLYGQFKKTDDIDPGMGTAYPMDLIIDRYDSDAAINFRINSYLKIFAGAKLMSFKYEGDTDITVYSGSVPLGTASITFDIDHTGFGPGGGVSGVFPLGGDFYILANISAMYLWGNDDAKEARTVSFDPSSNTSSTTKTDFTEYGINTGASLAYYIPAASVTISLGGRYQAYTTKYGDPEFTSTEAGVTANTRHDDKNKFYGATLSATYSFGI